MTPPSLLFNFRKFCFELPMSIIKELAIDHCAINWLNPFSTYIEVHYCLLFELDAKNYGMYVAILLCCMSSPEKKAGAFCMRFQTSQRRFEIK